MNLQQTYDRIAAAWHRDHSADTWWIAGTDRFASHLKPGDHVLDLGCGSGIAAAWFAARGFHVTGVDFSEKLLQIARAGVPSGSFIQADIRRSLPLDRQFDGLYAKAVFLHIPKRNIHTVFASMLHTLKPGGYSYVALKELRSGQPDEDIKRESDYGYSYERFFSLFTKQEVLALHDAVGLVVDWMSVQENGHTRWIQCIGHLPQRPSGIKSLQFVQKHATIEKIAHSGKTKTERKATLEALMSLGTTHVSTRLGL